MCYYSKAGTVEVEPAGDLTVSHDVDVTNPRSKLMYRTQRVAQFLKTSKQLHCYEMVIREDGSRD